VRRLRSALQAFRRVLPRKPRKRLVRALRGVTPRLGVARDWDVFAAWLESAGAPALLLAKARVERANARRRARQALGSRAWAEAVVQARALRAGQSTASLKEFAASAIDRAHSKALKEARGIDWRDAAQRHAVRVRLKRLRYTCDFLAHGFPPRRVAGYIGNLKRLQDILGGLNDIRVGSELFSELEADGGPVRRKLASREAALLRRLAPAWRAFEGRPPFWEPRERTLRRAAT
jgi:CHAD domain-containing protein